MNHEPRYTTLFEEEKADPLVVEIERNYSYVGINFQELNLLCEIASRDYTFQNKQVEERIELAIFKDLVEKAKYRINVSSFVEAMPLICLAVANEKLLLVDYMLKNGGNKEAVDSDGNTSLHLAAMSGNPLMIQLLLSHGADVNAQTSYGLTPLHTAVTHARNGNNNYKESIQLLLSNGANIDIKDHEEQTAEEYISNINSYVTPLFEKAKTNRKKFNQLVMQLHHNPAITTQTMSSLNNLMLDPCTPSKDKQEQLPALIAFQEKYPQLLLSRVFLSYFNQIPFNKSFFNNKKLFNFLVHRNSKSQDINNHSLHKALCVYHASIPTIFSQNPSLYHYPAFYIQLLRSETTKEKLDTNQYDPKQNFILATLKLAKQNRLRRGNRAIINTLLALKRLNNTPLAYDTHGIILSFVDSFGKKIKAVKPQKTYPKIY